VGDAGGRLVAVLGAGYPIAMRHLRRSFGAAAAARLTPRVTALAWHVATLTASDEAEALDQRVGTLSVTFDDKGCTQVLTLHLTPSEAPSLLAFAEKLLEAGAAR
jgi:predicted membrane-bound spermidine synthase